MKKQARQRGYKVVGELRPDQLLPHTGPTTNPREFFGHKVKMTSLRYQTFRKSLMCKCCGLYGTIFLLELPNNGGKTCVPHFNLYAEREGVLVQMTKDHIQPKSKGGEDVIGNMQTLCSSCNELKGSHASKLKRLREIQDGVQTVYMVSTPSGLTLNHFATSDKGLVEIVDRFIKSEYRWEEGSYRISISRRLGEIFIERSGQDLVFTLNTIRRV